MCASLSSTGTSWRPSSPLPPVRSCWRSAWPASPRRWRAEGSSAAARRPAAAVPHRRRRLLPLGPASPALSTASSRAPSQPGSLTAAQTATLPASFSPASASVSDAVGEASASPALQPSARLADPPLIWTSEPEPRDPDLVTALSQVKLVLEMMDNSDSPTSLASDDVVSMLIAQLRKAQSLVVAKLQRPSAEDRIQQLLQMNDALINTLSYYDGLTAGSMRRRNAHDEARRVAEQDDNSAAKPHIQRASSFDMQNHEVVLRRDNESRAAKHQYHAEGGGPAFSYATQQSPSSGRSHVRSPSAGSAEGHAFAFPAGGEVGERKQAERKSGGLSQFLSQQGLRNPAATSPQSAPPVSSKPHTSPAPPTSKPSAAAVSAASAAGGKKKGSWFGSSSDELVEPRQRNGASAGVQRGSASPVPPGAVQSQRSSGRTASQHSYCPRTYSCPCHCSHPGSSLRTRFRPLPRIAASRAAVAVVAAACDAGEGEDSVASAVALSVA